MNRYATWKPAPTPSWWPDIVAVAVASAIGVGLYRLFGTFSAAGMPLVGQLFVFLGHRVRETGRRREIRRRLDSRDRDELPVRMRVDIGKGSSRDEGMLVLVDGWLLFRGEKTEWSVRAADTFQKEADGPQTFRFSVPTGEEAFVCLFVIAEVATFGGMIGQGAVDRLMKRWREATPDEGVPLFPPAVPDPSPQPSRDWMMLLIPAIFLLPVASGLFGPVVAAAIFGGTLLIPLTFALVVRSRAQRALPPSSPPLPDRERIS